MLYIVSTPIGNLEDLSLRQAKTLLQSDVILAEDTRSARILLSKIPALFPNTPNLPNTPTLISYYKDVEFEKLPQILDFLKDGKKVSLISESGMPLISDPGYLLVKAAIREHLPFEVIPGPSAVITALVYSGFDPSHGFVFLGFFPKKKSEARQVVARLKQVKELFPKIIFVFYESPQRVGETLQLIKASSWNPEIVICREMTKKFEEIIRHHKPHLPYKGELTLVLH